MRNIKILLEYDGTEYAGWQVQPDRPTVQGTVIEAIKRLTNNEAVSLTGASRTDSGVHALGQTANFLTSSKIPVTSIHKGLNAMLPGDIVVTRAEEAPAGFDARRRALSKTYVYRVVNRGFPVAVQRRFCWVVSRPLDMELMSHGARYFPGKKDFTSFRAAGSDAPHSIREVLSVEVKKTGDDALEFEVRGTAFLRHMVRNMVGALAAVGMGKIEPSEIGRIIEARDRRVAPATAPARGLFLKEVKY
ncbi:MAG: tRNA pseudouridine(38-40) synthase TruA [Thermodesulfobacteriota bacterium]|nr:MAG: tRNA pseudouridine(38-40) synthase TruA [Thermodesulfobacteriota bacterium]